MNRHSVFFKLNLLFLLALIAMLVAGWAVWGHLRKRDRIELHLKGRIILQTLHRDGELPEDLLKNLELKPVDDPVLIRKMRNRMRQLSGRRMHGGMPRIGIVKRRGEPCLVLRTDSGLLLLGPAKGWMARNWPAAVLLGGMVVLLLLLYGLLRRSLLPLKTLEEEIRRYGEGEALHGRERLPTGEDEISRLSRSFYDAAQKVERLGASRRLFLRNILHELNTPVTKGKLLAEISEDPETKRMLHSIFERLSLLLDELAQVERIAAVGERPAKRPVRIVDLIDQARDRLYLEEPIPFEGENAVILADFASMAIVFKNLIDNGLKYGRHLRIVLREKRLEFVSEGRPLARPLEWYLKPFHREEAGTKGFGLGLYIVHEILRRQGMRLEYRHENGRNVFSVVPLDFAA